MTGEQPNVPPAPLHTCIHCQRITIEKPDAGVPFYVKSPHTRGEARAAARRGCPLFTPLFEDPALPEEPTCSRSELTRTLLSDSQYHWQARNCDTFHDRAAFLKQSLGQKPFRLVFDDLLSCKIVSDQRATLARWHVTSQKQVIEGQHESLTTKWYNEAPIVNKEVNSERTFCLASEWLHECSESHVSSKICPAISNSAEGFRPTRVIDVGNHIGHFSPRLVRAEEMTTSLYTCLSYCWGGDQPVKTIKATELEYYTLIPFEILPRTLKDTLIVAAKLDMQYIWIDALCIIQDSSEDMVTELASMPSIYRCAYFTIAVSSASTCHSGFLSPRTWSSNASSLRLTYRPHAATNQCKDENHNLSLINYDSFDWENDPAYTRAWIVQEHLLSPRVLDFTSVYLFPVIRLLPLRRRTGLAIIDHDTPGPASAGFDWSWAVEEYTKRNLSVPSDKLNAIAAVAQWCYSKRPSRYYAGLWQVDMLENLVLQIDTDAPLPRSSVYRAPSCSWAAVDGPVSISASPQGQMDDLRPAAEIVQCEVELKHNVLLFGEVGSARLVIRGPMRNARWYFQRGEVQIEGYSKVVTEATALRDASETGWPVSSEMFRHVELLEVFAQTSVYASRGLILVQDARSEVYSRVEYFAFSSRKRSHFEDASIKEITIV
ncbi:heterokaryon incompatibility protein-domain-containing protein [Phaeosphaeria sp. MPI-PUGE-AT-0046c]|nr:heterokaryon incompatibility protein-domain-containing protein [Phaeosphaeria sp. MPI-PUGE-AT-0046c]